MEMPQRAIHRQLWDILGEQYLLESMKVSERR